MKHIEKHTVSLVTNKTRLNRREEELVTQNLVCVNCDSFLSASSPDYCPHCCFYYDRKPGAITGLHQFMGRTSLQSEK